MIFSFRCRGTNSIHHGTGEENIVASNGVKEVDGRKLYEVGRKLLVLDSISKKTGLVGLTFEPIL